MLYHFILHSHFYTNPMPISLPSHLMKSMEVGWGNGYVLIPPGHPFHGKHYDSIDAYAHGGLTFSSMYGDTLKRYEDSGFDYEMDIELSKRVEKEGYDFLKDYWCIGFDTAHFEDNLITCPKEYVLKETDDLHQFCFENSTKEVRKAKLKKIKHDVR